MTTKDYTVAYPNSSIPLRMRTCQVEVGLQTGRDDIISQLCLEYPDHTEDLKHASLYKAVNLKLEDVETQSMQGVRDWFHDKHEDAELSWGGRIAKLFPDGPHNVSDDLADIVVISSDVVDSLGGAVLGDLVYTKARLELSKAIEEAPSPSDSVKSASAVKDATICPAGPRYGRPSHRFGPPTALFSKPLALLMYNLEHLESYSPEPPMLDHAFDFITHAADFADEDTKEPALKHTLKNLLPGWSDWKGSTPRKTNEPDAVWPEFPAYLVVELKNELGLSGDPFLKGLIAYTKLVTQPKFAPYLRWSNAPAILLSIAGNLLTISTAVFTDAVYADELLSVKLLLGPHGSDNVNRIARVFMAINESKDLLSELYRNLLDIHRTHSTPTPPAKGVWPNPTAYPPNSTTRFPKLDFLCKVDRADGTELAVVNEANKHHALYLAEMVIGTSKRVVLVKFSAKYHEDAHRLLAGANPPLAPALHFCTRVIGDMCMVGMEYVPKSEGQSLFFASPPQPALEGVRKGIDRALDLLHEKGLVFGDLRESNVLYLPKDGGRVLLVDFDGVGRDGKDRYSACLNPEANLGVVRGQIMEKEHDRINLEGLMARLISRVSRA